MRSIDDEQTRFYLERKATIQRWASLRERESQALDRFLRSLEPDVEHLARRLRVTYSMGTSGKTTILGLHEPQWRVRSHRIPVISVSVAWYSQRSSFTEQWKTAWVGLRREIAPPFGGVTSPLAERAHSARSGSPFPNSDGVADRWVQYRWEAMDEQSTWDDLTPYRDRIIESLTDAWATFSPVIDEHLDMALLAEAGAVEGPNSSVDGGG